MGGSFGTTAPLVCVAEVNVSTFSFSTLFSFFLAFRLGEDDSRGSTIIVLVEMQEAGIVEAYLPGRSTVVLAARLAWPCTDCTAAPKAANGELEFENWTLRGGRKGRSGAYERQRQGCRLLEEG